MNKKVVLICTVVFLAVLGLVLVLAGRGRACGDVCVAGEISTSLNSVRIEIEKRFRQDEALAINSGLQIKGPAERISYITNRGTIIVSQGSVLMVFEPIQKNENVSWACFGRPVAIRGILEGSKCRIQD